MKDILEFSGENRWLSNFMPAPVVLKGVVYPSVEVAYVAAKTLDDGERDKIKFMTSGQAKRYGRTLSLRDDWDEIKLAVMEALCRQKYVQDEYRNKLLLTGRCEIIEGNTWGDTYWGKVGWEGENHLGRIIMKIRGELASLVWVDLSTI